MACAGVGCRLEYRIIITQLTSNRNLNHLPAELACIASFRQCCAIIPTLGVSQIETRPGMKQGEKETTAKSPFGHSTVDLILSLSQPRWTPLRTDDLVLSLQ